MGDWRERKRFVTRARAPVAGSHLDVVIRGTPLWPAGSRRQQA